MRWALWDAQAQTAPVAASVLAAKMQNEAQCLRDSPHGKDLSGVRLVEVESHLAAPSLECLDRQSPIPMEEWALQRA
jgi:hypothetical protein